MLGPERRFLQNMRQVGRVTGSDLDLFAGSTVFTVSTGATPDRLEVANLKKIYLLSKSPLTNYLSFVKNDELLIG